MYLSSPEATICSSWSTVGARSLPLKPPIVTTGSPVAMMMPAVVCEPVAADEVLRRALVGLQVGDVLVADAAAALLPPPDGMPPPPPGPPALTLAGPAVTLLPFSERPAVARL